MKVQKKFHKTLINLNLSDMVKSEIETTVDCKSDSHICTECGEKLIKNRWWVSFLFAGVMFLPYLIALTIEIFTPEKLPEPYCYQEVKDGGTIKKIYLKCNF